MNALDLGLAQSYNFLYGRRERTKGADIDVFVCVGKAATFDDDYYSRMADDVLDLDEDERTYESLRSEVLAAITAVREECEFERDEYPEMEAALAYEYDDDWSTLDEIAREYGDDVSGAEPPMPRYSGSFVRVRERRDRSLHNRRGERNGRFFRHSARRVKLHERVYENDPETCENRWTMAWVVRDRVMWIGGPPERKVRKRWTRPDMRTWKLDWLLG